MRKKKLESKTSRNVAQVKNVGTIKIGEIEFKLLFSGELPPPSDEALKRLNDSIAEKGVQVPILVDEFYNVIDGEWRLKAAAKNNATKIPFKICPDLTYEEKKQLMIDLNLHRRHLSAKQLDQLIIKFRTEGRSLRQIGEKLGISHSTVKRKLENSNVTDSTVKLPNKIIGKDNKKRNARGKSKQKPSISVNSLKELGRAIDACSTAGTNILPNKNIDLKRLERIARERENERLRNRECTDLKLGKAELLYGDFRCKAGKIQDGSVSVVFSDFPYEKKSLPLVDDLGKLASAKLVPGGLLITYSGVLYLPHIYEMLGRHLSYLWTAAIYHSGGKKLVSAIKVQQAWKPILIYYKPPLNKYWKPFTDMVSGGQAKSNHDWEQAVEEAAHYLRVLCPKDGIVLDPMCGSGTTLLAGIGLGLQCIGIEIDKAAFATAQKRVNKFLGEMSNDAA